MQNSFYHQHKINSDGFERKTTPVVVAAGVSQPVKNQNMFSSDSPKGLVSLFKRKFRHSFRKISHSFGKASDSSLRSVRHTQRTGSQHTLPTHSFSAADSQINEMPPTKRESVKLYPFWQLPVLLVAVFSMAASHADELPNFSKLVEEEGDAVVKIAVVTGGGANPASGLTPEQLEQLPEFMRRFYEPQRERRGSGFGSGFIVSDDGYVITNAHVVSNATQIRVSLADQREFDAELVGSDKRSDVAVLKIAAENLPTVRLGDSDDVKVGEWVLAIGSPFGFEHTATQGIVSAVARNLPDETYVPFIQSDAAVNPGNSGGPLFNIEGEVIGVNSQIYSRSGGYQGLSFAIPINVVQMISDQLRTKGYASRGWLGVQIQDVNLALAESFGLDRPSGALVSDVIQGSPAEAAGVQAGDIILKFNSRDVGSSSKLPPLVGAVAPETEVDVKVLRNGKEKSLTVRIAELETDKQVMKVKQSSSGSNLGVRVDEIAAKDLEALGLDNGVVVTEVKPGSPASESGLQAGDVIVSINREPIESVEMLGSVAEKLPREKTLPMLVQRGESRTFVPIMIPEG